MTTTITSTSSLPTSRALLTSLLQAIANIPLLPASADKDAVDNSNDTKVNEKRGRNYDAEDNNPLRRVPPEYRHLLTTLHVLFPSMVLPALDLLERGCVVGIELAGNEAGETERRGGGDGRESRQGEAAWNEDHNGGEGRGDGGDNNTDNTNNQGAKQHRKETKPAFYLVQSSSKSTAMTTSSTNTTTTTPVAGATTTSTSAKTSPGGGGYVVRTRAWHCSCAAFAFSSVAAATTPITTTTATTTTTEEKHGEVGDEPPKRATTDTTSWSFGGLSLDGHHPGTGVPLCKHLLACVLAECWGAALGRYVVTRRVGREEMAGLGADV
ncbi:hypothetical protein VTJ49DRAFT_340 [Mycothermus thermophilus]|uniref:SWIM-type domain-containing protein n=1 Tax=Humicola insolens TaxID=85995 RepID=A0ABR3VF73_HUMIN